MLSIMSYNLSTMPGCSGRYNEPIDVWIEKGLTCVECAWEQYCKEYYDEKNVRRIVPSPEIDIREENTIINSQ